MQATYEPVRASPEQSTSTYLEDLRIQFTEQLALIIIIAASLGLWMTLRNPFPVRVFIHLALLLGLGVLVRHLVGKRPRSACYLLVCGLTAELLAAIWVLEQPLLPFLAVFLVLICAILVARSELIVSLLVLTLSYYLSDLGVRNYPFAELLVSLVISVVLAWLLIHTLYQALHWTWNMQQRTNHLLQDVRYHRGQLSETLKSFQLANNILRRTERELISARQQAERARRLKEQFAANISHELRTPLNLIYGFSEMMYRSPEVYGEIIWPITLRRDIRQVFQSSQHLMEMIDDILDLARFEMAGFTLNKERTDLVALLAGVVEIVDDLFRSHAVQLQVEIQKNLPSLEIDRTRIRQVLLNLLNNALRFTDEGGVRLEARHIYGGIVISVTDTGPGIAESALPHIFDEFYQADVSIRRDYQGAGLGLAICKRFVEAHEGEIWVESKMGIGSTFFFSLPIPDESISLSHIQVRQMMDTPWRQERPCILVVEQDSAIATLIQRHLDKYQIVHVADPAWLEQMIALHHPRAIIENVLPGESPSSLSTATEMPIVQCSLPMQAWTARQLSVEAFLVKPVTAQQLLAVISGLNGIRKVLTIDDDIGFSELVERILQSASQVYQVQHAYTGEDGLACMHEWLPDLVLLDLVIPDVDGFALLARMRQDAWLQKIPVVLLTATDQLGTVPQAEHQIVIQRHGGLHQAEVLRCLQSIVDVFPPNPQEQPP